MSARQAVTNLAYALLKIGAILYLFPIFWENIRNEDIGGNIVVTRLLIWGISYLVVSFIILVISRENFNFFGFGFVLVASVYRILQIIFFMELSTDLAIYVFVVCICFYFMTKEYRNRRRMVAGTF
jgi:hypothetical protein